MWAKMQVYYIHLNDDLPTGPGNSESLTDQLLSRTEQKKLAHSWGARRESVLQTMPKIYSLSGCHR